MNRYYLPVFDLMGYRILNPNQREYHLYYKNSFEKLEKNYDSWGYEYKDYKNGRRIVYNPSYESFRFYGEDLSFEVGNNGNKQTEEGEYEIFYSEIYLDYIHDYAKILVNQYPVSNDISSSIEVVMRRSSSDDLMMRIDLLPDKAVLTFLHEVTYPDRMFKEDEKIFIDSKDCTEDNFIKKISTFIKDTYTGDYNYENKKSLYIVLSTLKGCISDLISYWKKETIPYNIMDKEEQLKDLECLNDPNKEEEINKLRSELDTLKELCYGDNTTEFTLRG